MMRAGRISPPAHGERRGGPDAETTPGVVPVGGPQGTLLSGSAASPHKKLCGQRSLDSDAALSDSSTQGTRTEPPTINSSREGPRPFPPPPAHTPPQLPIFPPDRSPNTTPRKRRFGQPLPPATVAELTGVMPPTTPQQQQQRILSAPTSPPALEVNNFTPLAAAVPRPRGGRQARLQRADSDAADHSTAACDALEEQSRQWEAAQQQPFVAALVEATATGAVPANIMELYAPHCTQEFLAEQAGESDGDNNDDDDDDGAAMGVVSGRGRRRRSSTFVRSRSSRSTSRRDSTYSPPNRRRSSHRNQSLSAATRRRSNSCASQLSNHPFYIDVPPIGDDNPLSPTHHRPRRRSGASVGSPMSTRSILVSATRNAQREDDGSPTHSNYSSHSGRSSRSRNKGHVNFLSTLVLAPDAAGKKGEEGVGVRGSHSPLSREHHDDDEDDVHNEGSHFEYHHHSLTEHGSASESRSITFAPVTHRPGSQKSVGEKEKGKEEKEEKKEGAATETPPADISRASASASQLSNSAVTFLALAGSEESRYQRALGNVEVAASDVARGFQRIHRSATDMVELMRSWATIATGERFKPFALLVFERMLELNPEFSDLFMTLTLEEQACTALGMVGKAVIAYTRTEDMMDLLTEVGARHGLYGVDEQHFLAIRRAFMHVLPTVLSESDYKMSLRPWKTFWRVTIGLLTIGRTSVRAEYYLEMRKRRWILEAQAFFDTLAELQTAPSDMTPRRRNLFFVTAYDYAVEADPSFSKYAHLREPITADRSFEALLRLVRNLEEKELVEQYLQELGYRHYTYDLERDTIDKFRDAFRTTCFQYMRGNELMKRVPTMIRSVAEFWELLVVHWHAGWEEAYENQTGHPYHVDDGEGEEEEEEEEDGDDGGAGSAPKDKASSSRSPHSQGHHHHHVLKGAEIHAPQAGDPACLLFTDIEASTSLWETNPDIMDLAIRSHAVVIRGLISDYGGYEVKTVGDSFMVATKDPLIALKIALGIQLELMRNPITKGFSFSAAVPTPQGGGDPSCWRDDSVRVRVGIHYTTDVHVMHDNVHHGFDYFGRGVNAAARVEAAACGGQILMTKEAVDVLMEKTNYTTAPHPRYLSDYGACDADPSTVLSDLVVMEEAGAVHLKGIAEPMKLFSLCPIALAGRRFPQLRSGTPHEEKRRRTRHITRNKPRRPVPVCA